MLQVYSEKNCYRQVDYRLLGQYNYFSGELAYFLSLLLFFFYIKYLRGGCCLTANSEKKNTFCKYIRHGWEDAKMYFRLRGEGRGNFNLLCNFNLFCNLMDYYS